MRSGALSFCHNDGLPASWKIAKEFAGPGGRLATLPDFVELLIGSNFGEKPWSDPVTTLTAEYVGHTRHGNRILIVAHGIGPMATLDGVLAAYGWQYRDKSGNRKGGRITQKQFLDLEAGKFGEVTVIDFDSYCKSREDHFTRLLHASDAMQNPLFRARFGSRADRFVQVLLTLVRKWHQERAKDCLKKAAECGRFGYVKSHFDHVKEKEIPQHQRDGADDSDPVLIELSGDIYAGGLRLVETGWAFAHLVSIESLSGYYLEGEHLISTASDCQGWRDVARFIGIRANSDLRAGLSVSPSLFDLREKYWRDLLLPVEGPVTIDFRELTFFGGSWFVQTSGNEDGWIVPDPEFPVTEIYKVGEPILYLSEGEQFEYSSRKVRSLAPTANANAFRITSIPLLSKGRGLWSRTGSSIQYYHVEVDASRRLMSLGQLGHNTEVLMKLLEKEVNS